MARDKFIIVLTLFSFFLASCVKDPQDIPDGVEDNPVFQLTATLGNEVLDINAGLNGWTIQPVVEETDSNIIYTSIFSQNACLNNCFPSLEFKFFRQFPASEIDAQDFLATIQTGSKDFTQSPEELDSFEIVLSTHPALFMSGYSSWKDLNINASTFETEYYSTIGYNQDLNVCFQSLALTGCKYIQCIYFDPSTLVPCITRMDPVIDNEYLKLTVRPEGTPPFDIKWFNDSTSSTIVLPIQDSLFEMFASVTVTDALGNQSSLSQSIDVRSGNLNACSFPIELSSIPVSNTDPIQFADKVEIIYRDQEGNIWSSAAGPQDNNSALSILSVESIGLSPMGQPTYKTQLQFGVRLFNTITGEAKYFSSQEAVIGLSHR